MPTPRSETRHMKRILSVRVTPGDYSAIAAKAEACGLPIAEFVRRCSLGRPTRTRSNLQAIDELRRLGCRQRHLYSRDDANRERCAELFVEIQDAIRRVGTP
jgi:hypothetical protein